MGAAVVSAAAAAPSLRCWDGKGREDPGGVSGSAAAGGWASEGDGGSG